MRSSRHLTRFLCALISALVLGGIALVPTSGASLSSQISSQQSQATQLQQAIKADDAAISNTSSGLASAQAQLNAIQTKLTDRMDELKQVQTELMTARDNLARLEARLTLASNDLALNLRTEYEQGTPNLMTVILNSSGFSQLLDQVSFAQRISRQDAQIVGFTRAARTRVLAEADRLGRLELRDKTLTDEILSQRNQEAALQTALLSKEIAEKSQRSGTQAKLAGVNASLSSLRQKLAAVQAAAAAQARENAIQAAEQVNASAGNNLPVNTASMVSAPTNAPQAVSEMIAAANAIATLPYIWGGGHGSFISPGYDCSGSVSYVLNAAGLLSAPETSDEFMSYGDPGPGQYVTIYATDGHVWMTIDGRRFDTVALQEDGSRWADGGGEFAGYVERHPPGL